MQPKSKFKAVLLSRHDPEIQILAREFVEKENHFVGVITANDPLHLFFHNVDRTELEVLCDHIAHFLNQSTSQRIVLAGGLRPDALTPAEVRFKLETAAFHLRQYFPKAEVEALYVDQTSRLLEQVVSDTK